MIFNEECVTHASLDGKTMFTKVKFVGKDFNIENYIEKYSNNLNTIQSKIESIFYGDQQDKKKKNHRTNSYNASLKKTNKCQSSEKIIKNKKSSLGDQSPLSCNKISFNSPENIKSKFSQTISNNNSKETNFQENFTNLKLKKNDKFYIDIMNINNDPIVELKNSKALDSNYKTQYGLNSGNFNQNTFNPLTKNIINLSEKNTSKFKKDKNSIIKGKNNMKISYILEQNEEHSLRKDKSKKAIESNDKSINDNKNNTFFPPINNKKNIKSSILNHLQNKKSIKIVSIQNDVTENKIKDNILYDDSSKKKKTREKNRYKFDY